MDDNFIEKLANLVDKRINKALMPIREDLTEVKRVQETQVLPSVVTIEQNIKTYSDMYKMNNDNAKKLEKRVEILEDQASIVPPPELTLAEVK